MSSGLLRLAYAAQDRPGEPALSRSVGSGMRFWFELPRADQADLLRLGSISAFPPGAVLVRENDSSTDVMVLLAGCVKVASTDLDDRETVLGIRDAGEIIGQPRSASVYALRDVQALVIPLGWFNAFVRTHIDAAIALQCSLCARLLESDRGRRAATTEPVERRLATVLLDLAARYGEPCGSGAVRIDLPLSHGDLAGLAMTSCRTVDRALMRLRAEHVVTTGRRTLLIESPARLRALAPQAGTR